MKKIGLKALLLSAALSLASYAEAAEATLKLATDSGAKESPTGKALDRWADLIKEKSGGDIETRVFYQNQLGGQQEVFDQFMAGDVHMMINWPMTSYDKRISVIYAPYMFTTWEGALEAYKKDGWMNGVLDSIYQDNGLKFFGAWPEGFNGVGTKGSFAKTIEEASKLKVRVPPVFPFPQTVQAMGYQTASIDWGEVFTSIQTGVVDGDAANVIFYDYEYFRDTLDHYVRGRQNFITGVLSMNLEAWEKLDPKHQAIVEEAASIVMQEQFDSARITDEGWVAKWTELGKTYVELNDEEISALATEVRAKVWPEMEDIIGTELMNVIKKNAQQF